MSYFFYDIFVKKLLSINDIFVKYKYLHYVVHCQKIVNLLSISTYIML